MPSALSPASSSPSPLPAFSAATSREAAKRTLAILGDIPPARDSGCTVRLWDGTLFPDDKPRPCTISLNNPGSLRAMFLKRNAITLAEAYLLDHFRVDGDLQQMFRLVEAMAAYPWTLGHKLRLAANLAALPKLQIKKPRRWRDRAHLRGKPHSIERDKAAVAYHYNAPTEFFEALLDPKMVYSCAIFDSPEESLADAQTRKLDDVCRQLNLQPGQRLLDVGCGWGGLMIHAAQNYGVEVTGITVSQPQADEANKRIREAGLEAKCRALVADYREIREWESFDAISSIEMFEHVGLAMLTTYFGQTLKLLKRGGLFLNQGTTVETDDARKRYPSFIKQYVFPDGEILPIHVSIRAAEESGFEVLRLNSLRPHYVRTCNEWVKNLDAMHEKEVLESVGEPTWRVWRLYTGVSGHGFNIGRLNCYQTLMRKN